MTSLESTLVETWEDRKKRRAAERAAATVPEKKSTGRPKVIPEGSSAEHTLRMMWRDGSQIKVIAASLDVSEKAVKNAVARLKLPTRRPNIGKSIDLRIRVDVLTYNKLRRRASLKGASLAKIIRMAIQKEVEGM
jgi:O-acetylhomoserine/O-acetylserine sulfhydrylase-like pyridoxal-dependent enzyme